MVKAAKRQVVNIVERDSSQTNIEEKIPGSIKDIKSKLQAMFVESDDFVVREFVIGETAKIKVIVTYIDGMSDKALISDAIIYPLLKESRNPTIDAKLKNIDLVKVLQEDILSASEITAIWDFKEAVETILLGDTVIFIDGAKGAIRACSKGGERRNVSEPDTESVVRGPREGFTEVLKVNTSLLRQRIKSTKFKMETMQLGRYTKTDVAICYIKGVADESIVNAVKRRIKAINVDGVLESSYIEQYIEDAPLSLFPTVGNSERPDKVAAKILEGRVAIICDGSPIVLTVPYLFIEALQSTEDYYSRTFFANLNRLLRLLALAVAVAGPAIYVAILVYHFGIIPFELLLSIAATREGIPFEPFTEALLMILVFEALRESGVRMPKPVGQTISIVAGLVIGEAAVAAGVVSPIMVIIIAITGVCTFIVPTLQDVLPILRIILLFAANAIGLLGIYLALIFILVHLCSLRSFGVPYMSPFSPSSLRDMKDAIIRAPLWSLITRPESITNQQQSHIKYRSDGHIPKKED